MLSRRPVLPALFVSAVAFVVYQFTLAPGVSFIDAGELATDCYTLGIAHPTGYPLFTLVGYVFSHIPIGSVIWRVNEMAAVFTALGVGTLFLLAHELFSNWIRFAAPGATAPARKPNQKSKQNRTPERPVISVSPKLATIAAVSTALIAGFSETWWTQSTSIEVYPLHLFLVPLALFFFLRMLRSEEGSAVGRDGYLFALVLGLAFTNHMTTILLAPACLYAFFARYGFTKHAFGRIGRLALPFVAALLLYIYLPLRSSQFPLMDWGHPADLKLFLKHITGGQYKVWMFTGHSRGKNLTYFFNTLPGEFSFALLLSVMGFVSMFFSKRVSRVSIALFTVLLFVSCIYYAINYGIHDIDSYFLLAYLTLALWFGAGIVWLSRILNAPGERFASIVGAVLVVVLLGVNFNDVDESGNHMIDEFTRNELMNLPPNAIIFSSAWDFWVSSAFYYQNILHLRPDVLIVDRSMLHDRPSYFEYLSKRAPEVMKRAQPELSRFLPHLNAFDHDEPYSSEAISNAYRDFTLALVARNQDRPMFVAQDLIGDQDELFAPGYKLVPAGIAYRLVTRDTLFPAPVPSLNWNDAGYRKRNYYTDNARVLQALPLAAYAQRLAQSGDYKNSLYWIDLALKFKPDMDAKLTALPERDQQFAEATNSEFERIEQLREQYLHLQR